MTAPTQVAPPKPILPRHVNVRGREVPVVLPNRRDPRLKLSAVVMTLHVLGQTLLDFKVSIAQILITMAVCGLIEGVITFRNTGMVVWPASGILTGSSVALILRASGTVHGDYWSLNGIQFFVLAGAVSLLSKHLIRPKGRHLFNPSNVGIVWCLLVVGPNHVFAQYLWWGPSILGQVLAYAVILFGAFWILRAVRMIPMALAFMATFTALIGLFALGGREFFAIWHEGAPVGGMEYWVNVALSPEVLVFVFFMISDPQTAPKAPEARVVYGAAVALLAAALIFPQQTEFGIKVAILSSLTAVCAVVPLIEAGVRRWGTADRAIPEVRWAAVVAALRRPAVAAALIIAVAAPIDTVLLHDNRQVILIEQGQVGKANAQ
ncbi:MAG: RnfABCDGE type electron transport complex subunit D [Actinomycetota bacterium]|nr:RnfABCDGE type electron transport complex subunit D [Actinomycetota bacterium]